MATFEHAAIITDPQGQVFHTFPDAYTGTSAEIANDAGADGWEMVAMSATADGSFVVGFKRQT